MKCFYHNADLDGKCSAAIVREAFQQCELIGINYGDPFPWETIDKGEEVWMVDFSLQPFHLMVELHEHCKGPHGRLVWIDHHKTALADLAAEGIVIDGIQRCGTGACALVWEYIFAEPPPEGVRLLAEYDVWNHDDEDCLPFQYGMRNLPTDPDLSTWPNTVFRDEQIGEVVAAGHAILTYERRQNAIRAKSLCFGTQLDGLRCIAANQGLTNSKLFDSLWDPEKYDAMLCFSWRKGQWTVSLYTDKDDIDVGEVAKEHGGGGHKGAAGFQCRELPFELS